MKTASIIVIDDEPDNFEVIEGFLKKDDYELHYCNDGQQAINSLDFLNPDLILLDVMMPGLNGIEICQKIKARPEWQTIPIIIVTALTSKKNLAQCLEAGANDFISKPIDSLELRARIQSMLRIKKQYDQIEKFSVLQRDTINILGRNLDELTGNIAFNLSHEFNTPLNGIVGVIRLLKANLRKMDIDDIDKMLDSAERSVSRLEELTKKLFIYLELEKLSNHSSIASVQTKFSTSIIEAVLNPLAKKSHRADDLVLEIEEAEVSLSEEHLLIILHELIDNALKFSQPGTALKIKNQVIGEMLHLSIEDNGIGMTTEQISQIEAVRHFERQTYAEQGLGLGLKIVKKIVVLAKGKFSITSIPQAKTIVNISLPRVHN